MKYTIKWFFQKNILFVMSNVRVLKQNKCSPSNVMKQQEPLITYFQKVTHVQYPTWRIPYSEDWSSNGASDYHSACFNFRNLLGWPFRAVMK